VPHPKPQPGNTLLSIENPASLANVTLKKPQVMVAPFHQQLRHTYFLVKQPTED